MFRQNKRRIGMRHLLAALIALGLSVGIRAAEPSPNYTALWWNPSESGWGINFNHQGSVLFATLFTYDRANQPYWLVMANGQMQADGKTFVGDLYQTYGSPLVSNPVPPISSSDVHKVGSMSISFINPKKATLSYTVNEVSVSKNIEPQVFGSAASECQAVQSSRAELSNFQDLWWNPSESGWGLNITHQDDLLFGTLFTYDQNGAPLWLVMPSGTRQSNNLYSGDLFQTSGPAFYQPFTPIGAGNVRKVGTMELSFENGESGILTYTYSGNTVRM
jgi:hypothetical protein